MSPPHLQFMGDIEVMKITEEGLTDKKGRTYRPADYNPRIDLKPGDAQWKNIQASLENFNDAGILVVNQRTGNLVGGHQRLKIMRHLGWKTVEVRVKDLDSDREKALNAVLNNPNVAGDWDYTKLPDFLRNIDVDIQPMTGWDPEEIQKFLRLDGYRHDETKDPDSIPEEMPEPTTKKGDIIILGNHRLMCGDAVDHEEVSNLLQGEKARMIFTDPPYNVNYGSTKNPKYVSKSERNIWYGNRSDESMIANDNLSQDDWVEFNKKLYANFAEFCDGDIYMWGASGPDGMIARRLLVEMGCHWSATIAWVKDSLVLSPANFHRQYEPCFYGWFGKSSFNQMMNGEGDRGGLTDVWNVTRPKASKLHPTMKPVELCEKGIAYSSKEDDIVLDLFGGSGSTLIACEKIHRRCYMMEIESHYCDVIVKRWEDYTGKVSRRI